MTDLPAPLTPADCSLQNFPFMPLDVVRLRDSDLALTADADMEALERRDATIIVDKARGGRGQFPLIMDMPTGCPCRWSS